MSTVETTPTEAAEALDGYDEIGIDQQFGADLNTLLETKPTMGLRALIFADVKRRNGLNVAQAKAYAMELRMGEVTSYFADEPDDVDPDDPDSAAGKDSAPPA